LNKRLKWLIIALAVFGLIAIYQHWTKPKPLPMIVGPFAYLGKVSAQKVTEVAGGQGTLVIWHPTYQMRAERSDAVLAGFRSAIKEAGGLTISAEEQDAVAMDPMSGEMKSSDVGGQRLLELLAKHSTADLLVLIGGLPDFHGVDVSQLGGRYPKVFFVKLGGPPIRSSVSTHPLFGGAIVNRLDAPTTSPQTEAERVDAYYEYIAPR